MALYRWQDPDGIWRILKNRKRNAIAKHQDCCCETENDLCCQRGLPGSGEPDELPSTLTLTLTDVSSCPCIDGHTITLTWDAADSRWEGTGSEIDGSCQADTITWHLVCIANQCEDWSLSATATICTTTSNVIDPDTCSCDPLFLEFYLTLGGLGCCEAFPGTGDIKATITE